MRTFDKSTKLDNVLYDVRGPVVDEAARMEDEGKEILKLNIGNPYPFGFSAPQEVILDMLSNIRTSQGYSDSKGIFSARKAIMQYAQLRNIPNVSMNDIYTGLFIIFQLLFSTVFHCFEAFEHNALRIIGNSTKHSHLMPTSYKFWSNFINLKLFRIIILGYY